MATLLWNLIFIIGVVILALVIVFFVREALIHRKKQEWIRQKEECFNLVGKLKDIEPDEIIPLVLELKKTYPMSLIESVLDEIRLSSEENEDETEEEKSQKKEGVARAYDALGFLDKHIQDLGSSENWFQRVYAADVLGQIRHSGALEPLMERIQDKDEDQEVKNASLRAVGKIANLENFKKLVDLFETCDYFTSNSIADIIIPLGSDVDSYLSEKLSSSKSEKVRFWIVRILAHIPTHVSSQALLKSLGDHSSKVRAETALALGQLNNPEASIPLSKMLLRDPVSAVRIAVAESLGIIATEKDLVFIRESLKDLDDVSRIKVISALEKMGNKAIPFFLDALVDDVDEIITEAAVSLERVGTIQQWIEELDSDEWEKPYRYLQKVAKAGVVETISRSLFHEKKNVRLRLCKILFSATNKRAAPSLLTLFEKDETPEIRMQALTTLMQSSDADAGEKIEEILEKDVSMRLDFLRILEAGSIDLIKSMEKTLVYYLEDTDEKIRYVTLNTLVKLTDEAPFEAIINLREDSFDTTRELCAQGLKYFKNNKSIETLIELLEDSSKKVRIAAIQSLGHIGDGRAILPLSKSFEIADRDYRDDISEALAKMPEDDFYENMDLLMAQSHPSCRAGIAWTLGLIGDEKYFDLLSSFLRDPVDLVRSSAAGAISKLDKKEVPNVLLEVANDPNERVRAAIVNGLSKYMNYSLGKILCDRLELEPDKFVHKRIFLAIAHHDFNLENEEEKKLNLDLKEKLMKWITEEKADYDQAIGRICLGAIGDIDSFELILNSIKDPRTAEYYKEILRNLSMKIQKNFLKFLHLDSSTFWSNLEEESIMKHYVEIVQSDLMERNRSLALKALAFLGGEKAIQVIKHAKDKDPSPFVRVDALNMLFRLLSNEDILEEIIKLTKDPSQLVVDSAIKNLKTIDPDQIFENKEKLLFLLETVSEKNYAIIAEVLSKSYTEDWNQLADEVLADASIVRMKCLIKIISYIKDPKTIPLFHQFMVHKEKEIRAVAAAAIAENDIFSKEELLKYANDPVEEIRASVIKGLVHNADIPTFEKLKNFISDPAEEVRIQLAWGFSAETSHKEFDPIDVLLTLARDHSHIVKLISYLSLYRIGYENTISDEIERVVKFLSDKQKYYLHNFLEKENFYEKLVNNMLESDSPFTRKESLSVLSALDLQNFIEPIMKTLGDFDPDVRLTALRFLSPINNQKVKDAISTLRNDPSNRIQDFFESLKLFEPVKK